jgi:hypothetical protein
MQGQARSGGFLIVSAPPAVVLRGRFLAWFYLPSSPSARAMTLNGAADGPGKLRGKWLAPSSLNRLFKNDQEVAG